MATIDDVYAQVAILLGLAGSNTITIRVIDSNGDPLAGVGIIVESIYGNLIGVAISDAAGYATMKLDASTYNVYLRQTGTPIVFANPFILVVATSGSVEFQASSPGFSSPPDPSMARVYGWIRDLGMTPQEGVKVVFSLKESNVVTDGGILLSDPTEVTTDVDGYFEASLPIALNLVPSNVSYFVQVEEAFNHTGFRLKFCADCLEAGGSYRLSDLCR